MMMIMTDKMHLNECMNLLVPLVILQPRNSSDFISLVCKGDDHLILITRWWALMSGRCTAEITPNYKTLAETLPRFLWKSFSVMGFWD